MAVRKLVNSDLRRDAGTSQLEAPRPDWLNERTLEPIRQVNRRYFELLLRMGRGKPRQAPSVPDSAADWLRRLQKAPSPARQRAAQTLFLMADLRFQDAVWWERERHDRTPHASSGPAGVPRKLSLEVTQASLLLAWHTARSHAHAARLLVGLDPKVAEILAELSPVELGPLAERHCSSLRPRWHDRVALWQKLLCAATDGSQGAWRDFHLDALQVVATELDGAPPMTRRSMR